MRDELPSDDLFRLLFKMGIITTAEFISYRLKYGWQIDYSPGTSS